VTERVKNWGQLTIIVDYYFGDSSLTRLVCEVLIHGEKGLSPPTLPKLPLARPDRPVSGKALSTLSYFSYYHHAAIIDRKYE
jgi:hypothetical protein